ncbi:hypothetical protein [Variovorax sp. EBFNA2]|uniref:hypothetical protein n=1 Tax=Variovorax sp. EBFNA2 TaxID=3342097 RepID=UPI0029C0A414|nr:hypothetical protein [Variovorax boronicumulans]WPG41210.1 hypothetical protein RZE79_34595 [Variovorax boronicumulans]
MEITRARNQAAEKMSNALVGAASSGSMTDECVAGGARRPGRAIALLTRRVGRAITTLAMDLNGEPVMAGSRDVLVDADRRGPALNWTQRRLQSGLKRSYDVSGMSSDTLHLKVPRIAAQAHCGVTDRPRRDVALARSGVLAFDRVLIPVQPSAYDVWERHGVVAHCRSEGCVVGAVTGSSMVNPFGRDITAVGMLCKLLERKFREGSS